MRIAAPGLLLLFAVVALAAEEKDPKAEALDLIDKGRAAVVAGRPNVAVAHLQDAIAKIQAAFTKNLASFLPEPGEGWTAGEPDTNTGSWGSGEGSFQWSHASRDYTRKSDDLRVAVVISNSPQLVRAQKQMAETFKNPQMRAMMERDPDKTIETSEPDGWFVLVLTEKGRSAQVLAFKGKTMVSIDAKRDDAAAVKEIWNAIDRKGLGSAE